MTSSSSAVLLKHAGDVEADVAGADDRDVLGLERPGAGDVGVAVEPGDELGAAVAARQVDAGDVERPVLLGAGGEDDGVVVALEVLELDVDAVLDVAEQPDAVGLVSTWRSALTMPLMRGWSGATP